MDLELYDLICDDVSNRISWAERQSVWYQLRRQGIKRKNMPWKNAADMHYPLVDTAIEKIKPFYVSLLFSTERIADMVSKNPQAGEEVIQCAYWLDYKLKQESNLEDAWMLSIDSQLQNGRGIIKPYWHAGKEKLCFDAIEPLYLIVPSEADSLEEADRIVHVKHLSEFQYKQEPKYRQGENWLSRIKGGQHQDGGYTKENVKEITEGITHFKDKNTIIIWEVYERLKDGEWMVHTISPYEPYQDVRKSFKLPYKLDGEHPFCEFTMEITEKGYYSPRGVAEILAHFEQSMCKQWNEKHDAMTLFNRPIFTAERDIPNAANLRLQPGAILPFPVKALQSGAPAISWDEDMAMTRMVAEQRIAVPDFGVGDKDTEKTEKTAREVGAIQETVNRVVDMRARISKRQLSKLLRISWKLEVQYDEDLSYIREGKKYAISKDQRDEIVSCQPNGSSDSWNMERQKQKAVQLKVMLAQSPYVNQGELDKMVIEKTEPGLVQRLYRDPEIKSQDEREKQMIEISALDNEMPISAKPGDDHISHASVLMQDMARELLTKEKKSPGAMQVKSQHLQQHMGMLNEQNPQLAKQMAKEFQATMQQIMEGPPQLQQGKAK